MAAYRHSLRIRYQECDAQGVVYFTRYAEYYDIALTELFREAIGSYQAMVDAGTDLVVAELSVRYRASARFDDVVEVALGVDRMGDTSLLSSYRISRGDELLVEGEVRHVCIDVATKAKTSLPGDIRAALARYAEHDAG